MSERNKTLPHDASYKDFFSHPAMVVSLLRDFVREPFISELDFGTLQRLSGEYVGRNFTRGFSDMVWRLRWRNRDWCYVVLLLEFQSSPDPLMALRIMVYSGQLLLRLAKEDKSLRAGNLPAVLPIVLYNGEPPWNAPLNAADLCGPMHEALRACLFGGRYFLVDERRLDAEREEVRNGRMGLLARFGQAKTQEAIQAVLADMARAFRDSLDPDLDRVFIEWAKLTFRRSGIPGDWEKKLNNFDEVKDMLAATVEQWKADWKAEARAAGLAEGRTEGIALGRAEGRAEGHARGELQNQKETLLEILESKFAGAVPQATLDYLGRETDLKRLRRLTVAASCADSAADFTALVDKERIDAGQAGERAPSA